MIARAPPRRDSGTNWGSACSNRTRSLSTRVGTPFRGTCMFFCGSNCFALGLRCIDAVRHSLLFSRILPVPEAKCHPHPPQHLLQGPRKRVGVAARLHLPPRRICMEGGGPRRTGSLESLFFRGSGCLLDRKTFVLAPWQPSLRRSLAEMAEGCGDTVSLCFCIRTCVRAVPGVIFLREPSTLTDRRA